MAHSRRRFIANLALSGAGIVAGSAFGPGLAEAFARRAAVGNALRFPPLFDGGDLVAERREIGIYDDRPTSLLTFGGSFPGPTIRVRRGQELRARLVNRLDEPTNVHWHGLLAPAMMDGHPMHVVAPGESREYRFTVDQRAGTYWYHPHAHMSTARQAYLGMAGFFIVDDPDEESIGLPSGARDVPIVLQDRRIGVDRSIAYAPSMMDTMSGMLGPTLLVNGTPDAYHEVSRDLYRVRVLNGSNARIYRLGLGDGETFHLIASDAGLLDRPHAVTETFLAPGERVELLVDFTQRDIGTSVMLRSLVYDNAASPQFQGWPFDVLRFDVTRPTEAAGVVAPVALATLDRPSISPATRTRTMRLAMVHMHPAMAHTINGRAYDMSRTDERIVAGATEVWELVNDDNDEPHPMHLHAAHFQVLERNGAPSVDPKDLGWKDTVLVDPIERVKVAVRFGDETGMFVAHCHNLEHEDSGMMINMAIESAADAGADADAHYLQIDALAPNPATDHVELTASLRSGGPVMIELFDAIGRRVRAFDQGRRGAGTMSALIDVSELAEGAYLLRVSCGDRSVDAPVRVVR